MYWILLAIVAIAAILLLLALLCLHAAFGVRCEGNPALKYFTADDFDDINAEPVSFPSDRGQLLCGAVYTARGVEPTGLVVFAHGMGGGHLSYTTEFRTIAKAGFAVLSYDNTGTMASEGKALRSFYQAVKDLRAALKFVQGDEKLSKYKIVLAGHSWGGYTVCQSLAFAEKQVAGVVAFSPPNSAARVICDNMSQTVGVSTAWLLPAIWVASVIRGGWSSRRKCSSVLLNTDKVPVLLLQGDADTAVLLKNSPVSNPKVKAKENITGILYEGKAHNVYQTKESEKYLNDILGTVLKQNGKTVSEEEKSKLYDIDYELITQEDAEVMKTVTEFIGDCIKRSH